MHSSKNSNNEAGYSKLYMQQIHYYYANVLCLYAWNLISTNCSIKSGKMRTTRTFKHVYVILVYVYTERWDKLMRYSHISYTYYIEWMYALLYHWASVGPSSPQFMEYANYIWLTFILSPLTVDSLAHHLIKNSACFSTITLPRHWPTILSCLTSLEAALVIHKQMRMPVI